jgi:hypothetical protein
MRVSKRFPTLKGSNNPRFEFDPFGVGCDGYSDPVALPPAIKFVRYANMTARFLGRASQVESGKTSSLFYYGASNMRRG